MGGEGKKIRCCRKNMYFKETTRVECANCALKIIIFRYFALFLELTFYFLLFIHYIFFLCTTFSGMDVRTVCTGSYAPDCLLLEATCNFDVSLCGFVQGTDDKFNWTRHKGNTPSSGTRPSFDYTTGDMTGEL